MSGAKDTLPKPASSASEEETSVETAEGEAPRKTFVQSLERGLSVLMAFDA